MKQAFLRCLIACAILCLSCSERQAKNLLDEQNNMINHKRNRAVIDELISEIKSMEVDSADIKTKLELYTADNPGVIEDEARKRGLLKKNEDVYIIKR